MKIKNTFKYLLPIAIISFINNPLKAFALDCDVGKPAKGVEYGLNYWSDGKRIFTKTYILRVKDPEAVSSGKTIDNMVTKGFLKKLKPATVVNLDEKSKIFNVKNREGGYTEVEIEGQPDDHLRCYNYKNQTVTIYEFYKYVSDTRSGRIKAIGLTVEKYTFPIKNRYSNSF